MARNTLTAEQIVTAAIALLDSDGLDGLNMRSLGQRLGSAATAIYWHIKTKDDLVRLAADAVWNEVELPDIAASDWRSSAFALATGMRGMLNRHPWLGQAFSGHLLYGAGKMRFDEHSLAVYEKAGFAPADADRAAATVFVFVVGSTLDVAAEVSLTRRLSEEALREAVSRAHEIAEGFPLVRARLRVPAAADYSAAPEGSFEFGLRAVLDGFEARLGARPTG
ncbi:TetR/AcrR family transcriptional regulator [Allokutzneria sp. NRRL B-24872]|uniref:TetR/AcrR family transcriptional regulator n=1 Tax=Allokutzneria sp. NRRL B-24872 TaxID=1137961 RepID=UPI000A37CD7E|nr:TetR/AcrR family transcriptional regulator C-terminal domain-containing protein [Allokutzneria sp. NRRL B-24872]